MQRTRKDVAASKEKIPSFGPISGLFAVFFAIGLILGACSQSAPPEKDTGKAAQAVKAAKSTLYDASKVNCTVFSKDDAAAILGLPAAEIQISAQELYAGNWQCGYKGGSFEKMVSFNVSLAKSVDEAVNDMDQYRSHLGIAKDTKPFKDDLEKGAYSDISGVGDDALWTAVNGTLTVRKGNLSLQVQLPKEKDVQIKVAEKFLSLL